MKKTVSTWMLALVLVASAFVSCSKNDEKPNPNPGGGGGDTPPPVGYSMTMKIDGAQKSYTNVTAAIQGADGGQIIVIDGFKDATQNEVSELILGQSGTISAGEYLEGEHDGYGIAGVFKQADIEDPFVAGVTLNDAAPFKIKITSITADVVKGTFSGSYYDGEGAGTNKRVITDGQFNVKIAH